MKRIDLPEPPKRVIEDNPGGGNLFIAMMLAVICLLVLLGSGV